MNKTTYLPQRGSSFTHHMRRNSLQALSKLKNNSVHQGQQNFRRSCSSFDRKKSKQQLPQIRYQKEMDHNIYFNPHSRANYFKNLIDSYFQKTEDKAKINKVSQVETKNRGSYLLRRSILTKKNQTTIITSQNNKNQAVKYQNQPQNKQSKLQITSQKLITRPQKQQYSIRYKQQHSSKNTPVETQKQLNKKSVQQSSFQLQKQKQAISSQPSFQQLSFLPRITQAMDDDIDQDGDISSKQDLMATDTFMRSQSSFSRLQDKKILIYENTVLKLYTSWQNQKKYRIKEFKDYIFLKRHNRALQQGIHSYWKPYKFNQLSLIIPFVNPIKDLLFKLVPHPTSPQYYHIHIKPFYQKLTANHCQQLYLMFRQFIKDLSKTSKKVINNKINLSNIFYLNGKLCLVEWEYSAFKQENEIQGNHFQSRVEPILKCNKEWLVSPQYLAPQILQSIEDSKKPFDLWEYENVSDIYSTGLSFLQIITLIPMWMQYKTSIKGKIMKPRQGCIATSSRSTMRILQKQKVLQNKIHIILERELNQSQKNWNFFNILLRMIEPNQTKRINMQQLLKEVQ